MIKYNVMSYPVVPTIVTDAKDFPSGAYALDTWVRGEARKVKEKEGLEWMIEGEAGAVSWVSLLMETREQTWRRRNHWNTHRVLNDGGGYGQVWQQKSTKEQDEDGNSHCDKIAWWQLHMWPHGRVEETGVGVRVGMHSANIHCMICHNCTDLAREAHIIYTRGSSTVYPEGTGILSVQITLRRRWDKGEGREGVSEEVRRRWDKGEGRKGIIEEVTEPIAECGRLLLLLLI